MTKCIEIIVLKFKTNKTNIQRDIDIVSSCEHFIYFFFTVHVLMIAKKKIVLKFHTVSYMAT